MSIFKRVEELLERTESYIRTRPFDMIVYASIMAYSAVFSYLSILRHNAYGSAAWDLGIFNQAFWTTTRNGMFFFNTVEQYIIPSGSFFGIHFSPILFLILPIYALAPAPETLLIIQSIVLASAALPIYLLARTELGDEVSGALLALTYLVYPLVQGVNWFDFHVEAFLPLFLILSVKYLREAMWSKHLVSMILTLSVMEQAAVIVVFIGLYELFIWRKQLLIAIKTRRWSDPKLTVPSTLIALSVGWYQIQAWAKSTFFPVNPSFLAQYKAVDHWSILGVTTDPIQIPLYLVLSPLKALQALFFHSDLKIIYLVILFAPLLFLPLRNSYLLIALAWLGPALLSNYSPYYVIGYQYSAFVIPFMFVSTILALKRIGSKQSFPKSGVRNICLSILILTLSFSVIVSPYSPIGQSLKEENILFFLPTPVSYNSHTALLDRFVQFIPPNASVLTQNNIFPHLSNRVNAYVSPAVIFGPPERFSQYLSELLDKSDYVLVDMSPNYIDPSSQLTLDTARLRGDFGLYSYADGIHLLKRNYSGQPMIYGEWTQVP